MSVMLVPAAVRGGSCKRTTPANSCPKSKVQLVRLVLLTCCLVKAMAGRERTALIGCLAHGNRTDKERRQQRAGWVKEAFSAWHA